ncbi:hypothetical protein ACEPAI_7385 [Sanghuangporus weigelae]
MSGRGGSRGGSRSSASNKVTTRQARNTVKVIQSLGLAKNNSRLMKASSDYEKNIGTAQTGVERNRDEIRDLPDEIERASMRGQPQLEEELGHSLETTRPAEQKMYQKWINRLEGNLTREAQRVMTEKGIANLVPKDREITDDDINTIKAHFH